MQMATEREQGGYAYIRQIDCKSETLMRQIESLCNDTGINLSRYNNCKYIHVPNIRII